MLAFHRESNDFPSRPLHPPMGIVLLNDLLVSVFRKQKAVIN